MYLIRSHSFLNSNTSNYCLSCVNSWNSGTGGPRNLEKDGGTSITRFVLFAFMRVSSYLIFGTSFCYNFVNAHLIQNPERNLLSDEICVLYLDSKAGGQDRSVGCRCV